ncbi:hypothetical protein [Gloeobacter morelensis]|uniref:Uncharacterized protein n=1 Tax=Gloeobacter morelensis MG652769 TaxID=2781736 RepID=A0ABY3PRV3_9CYAN|nr:hypothetical protein [Gloeobacter morelensis]UFP96461.1 hypothetical protein ISF26_09715 [Gloeobacter morelensis MG652769]
MDSIQTFRQFLTGRKVEAVRIEQACLADEDGFVRECSAGPTLYEGSDFAIDLLFLLLEEHRAEVVRLWELDPAPVLASGLVGLMPLVPLMAGQDLELLLERSTEVIQAEVQSAEERNEVLAVTGLLASLKDERVVEQFFRTRSIMSLLSETPLFQALTQERVQEAIRQSKLQSLLALLEHKFGPLPDDLREALLAIEVAEELDGLLLAAADARDLQGVRNRL